MRKLKISAIVLLLAISMIGCSAGVSPMVATYKEYTMAPGVYLNLLLNSYYQAKEKVEDSEKDVLKQTVEEKDAEKWIIEEAQKNAKAYFVIEEKFDEMGLTLTPEEESAAAAQIEQEWQYYGKGYEESGISKESSTKLLINSVKYNKMFNKTYAEGGTEEVSKDELTKGMEENHAKLQYIAMRKTDKDGAPLNTEDTEKMKKQAQDYVEKAKKEGQDFQEIILEQEKAIEEDPSLVHDHEEGMHDIFLQKGSMNYPVAFEELGFSLKNNEIGMTEDQEYFYIIKRFDITEKPEDLDNLKYDVLYKLKAEEFETKTQEWAEAITVDFNAEATKKYTPKSLKI